MGRLSLRHLYPDSGFYCQSCSFDTVEIILDSLVRAISNCAYVRQARTRALTNVHRAAHLLHYVRTPPALPQEH
jgi:hypothetical protein